MEAPTPTPPRAAEMRRVLALMPTAVTIVSAAGAEGSAGATANAVASLSLDPPLLLACLDRGSRTLTVIRESGGFAVSVLGAGQEDLARGFASKAAHTEKWRGVPHRLRGGLPVVDGAVAWIACGLRSVHDGGDHEILIGEPLEVGGDGGEPLLFLGGEYRGLG